VSLTVPASGAPLYGGHRLQPAHFEPDHVPVEVARHGTATRTLPVGSPGKVGILELEFAVRGEGDGRRTELVHHFQKTPLQIMRPLYHDPLRPDMPYTYLMTTGGGILHGDRQRMDLRFGPGSSAHVTTQAHTKVYRMDAGYATALVNIRADEDAYVEYLPDPLIPFAGARFSQRTAAVLHPTATLVTGETVYAGRLTRGERNAYDVLALDFEVRRPDGRPIALDRARFVPEAGRVGGLSVLADHDIVSTLYAVSPLAPAARIAQTLHDAVSAAAARAGDPALRFGVSTLPDDAGAWLRVLADDTIAALAVQRAAADAVHELLTGRPAPLVRKS